MKPIYLQLYSVRDACAKDLEGTLKLVKEMGYEGVETAGFHGLKPKEFRKLLNSVGLKCESGHFPIGVDALKGSIEAAKEFGVKYLVFGFGPNSFSSIPIVEDSIAKFQAAAKEIEAAGMVPLMHNHWWEFEDIGNRLVFDSIKDNIPSLKFELDCYWCSNFGKFDPAEILRKNASRIPTIHIKDGTFERNKPFKALGEGLAKIDDIVKAANYKSLKFMTVEIDNCEGDMLDTIRRSFTYLDKIRRAV